MKRAGIYIHIPFCKQACSYCDFYFETSLKHRNTFIDKLIEEITYYRQTAFAEMNISTIYFGGGTPSRLHAEEWSKIMSALYKTFRILSDAECTAEVNPEDITPEYLSHLHDTGVNRLSIGIQSFKPDILEFMNRAHTSETAKKALLYISGSKFINWTADLIYGNPGQSLEEFKDDVYNLLEFNPKHISSYSLTVEPHTRLGSWVRKKIVVPQDDENVANQLQWLSEYLESEGFIHYEVSNFAKPGFESIHNSSYWSHVNYLGLGPSAHSFLWGANNTSASRWKNSSSLRDYMNLNFTEIKENEEHLSRNILAEERIMTGLRTKKGITLDELSSRYNYNIGQNQQAYINQLKKNGYIIHNDGELALSKKGLLIADTVILELISRHEDEPEKSMHD